MKTKSKKTKTDKPKTKPKSKKIKSDKKNSPDIIDEYHLYEDDDDEGNHIWPPEWDDTDGDDAFSPDSDL